MKTYTEQIEAIRTETGNNKSEGYTSLMDNMEVEISKILASKSDLGFICKKFAEEVSLNYNSAKSADCEYALYVLAHKSAGYADLFIQHSAKY
jgi:hypothetical protein